MPAASENSELYRDPQSSVSPSWLINGKSRYAVKTLVRLEFHTISQPRVRAGFMMLLGIVLTSVSARYILIDAQPYLIPYIMLAGSMTLMAGGACVLYLARPRFRIDMTLLDGSCVSLRREKKADAESLLAGLGEAMDWHRNVDVEVDADLELQGLSPTSRVKHGIARASDRQVAEPRSMFSHKTAVQKPVVSPVVAIKQTNVKAHIAPLLNLLSAKRRRRPVD